ncbi:MAG: YceI family protein [Phaeodactylibacter sp.]|nr:YceI family protein [Phaeodactylibacter sp.]
MRTKNYRYFSIGILLALLTSSIAPSPPRAELSYRILQTSRLFLEGTTNVNTFICNCTCIQSFPRLQFEMEVKEESEQAIFEEAQLRIRTRDLDCGNRNMNKDMYETLKANQYPSIAITILEAGLRPGEKLSQTEEWSHIVARAQISVAGVTRTALLKVRAKQIGTATYRFLSQYTIKMTDFNIDPPTAMLGLVKVNDKIEINFDLTVAVEEAG